LQTFIKKFIENDSHMGIREIDRRGLLEIAQRHFGAAQPRSDHPMHGAAQRAAVTATRLVVIEVLRPRLTNELLRQQPQQCHDIGLFDHLGSLRPLSP
jgi:hypothetical protein